MGCLASCVGGDLSCIGCGPSGSQLDTLDSGNTSGTVAFNPNTNAGAAGGVINTASNPLPAPDASGGNGNFLSSLQQTLTQGLNDSVVSATEFGLGALNDRLSVAATGQVQPGAAQSPAQGLTNNSSLITYGLIALAIYFIYELVYE